MMRKMVEPTLRNHTFIWTPPHVNRHELPNVKADVSVRLAEGLCHARDGSYSYIHGRE